MKTDLIPEHFNQYQDTFYLSFLFPIYLQNEAF